MSDPRVDPAQAGHGQQLASLYTEVGRRLRRFTDRAQAAGALTKAAVDLVPQAAHAGMTLVRPSGSLTTVGATAPIVDVVDRAQYDLGSGPCVDTVVDERLHVTGDLATDSRWPEFGARAAGLGVRSMASYRVCLADTDHGDDVLGGINLYASTPDAFDAAIVGPLLTALSTYAALAIWGTAANEELDSLKRALASSREIGIAQGILVERFKVTPEEAFGLLAMASQNSNRKLHDVAAHVAQTGEVPLPPPRRRD